LKGKQLSKKLIPLVLAVSLLASACVPTVETTNVSVAAGGVPQSTVRMVQATIREMMKDPESTKFRRTKTYRTKFGDQIVCGEYDARNSFGGYNGYEEYYFRLRNGAVMSKLVDSSSSQYFRPAADGCAKAANGSLPIPTSQTQ
jgi:hypothetical protein